VISNILPRNSPSLWQAEQTPLKIRSPSIA
jgi:hypothetical protein